MIDSKIIMTTVSNSLRRGSDPGVKLTLMGKGGIICANIQQHHPF